MLQQTTVPAVLGRYERFLERFPDLERLARASLEEVLAAWSGLGYYARARHLHAAARELALAGRWPRTPERLRALPGFGEYMAAAVADLAFGARAPAVDANVSRVLSRLDAIGGRQRGADARAVRAFAAGLLARGRPADVLAALMDLGQTICTPRDPDCGACPLASLCRARRNGAAHRYPRRAAKPPARRVFMAAACAVRGRSALLTLPARSRLAGLWQFPAAEGATRAEALRGLRLALAPLGLVLEPDVEPASARHTIMNRRLDIRVYRARPAPDPKLDAGNPVSLRWFTPARLSVSAIPTLTRRIAAAAGFLPAA
jgi:A/G-specific adenine glycosylase